MNRELTEKEQIEIIAKDHADELPEVKRIAAKLAKLSGWRLRDKVREFCKEAPIPATNGHLRDREYLLAAWHLLDVIAMMDEIRKELDK